jgi:ATP-dependent RNA helicase RhlE
VVIMVGAQKPASGIVQSVYPVAQERKAALLTTLLKRDAMTMALVFVKRKIDADRLARTVARSGVPATSIHSDRRQEDRLAALEAFRRGEYPVLIATDVAARGIDVDGISHVVNFDVPFSSDDYIHRGGRTARAGAVGEVVTFVAPDEEEALRTIEKTIGTVLPRVILPNFDHGKHERVPAPVAPPERGARRRGGRGRGQRPVKQGAHGEPGAPPATTHGSAAPDAGRVAEGVPKLRSPRADAATPASDATAAGDQAGAARPRRRRRRGPRKPASR